MALIGLFYFALMMPSDNLPTCLKTKSIYFKLQKKKQSKKTIDCL